MTALQPRFNVLSISLGLVAVSSIAALGAPEHSAAATRPASAASVGGSSAATLLDGKRVVARSPLSTSTKSFTVAGVGAIGVQDVASAGLSNARRRTQSLRGVRPSLLADPVETEEVVDTADGTAIRNVVDFTVVDPSGAASADSGLRHAPPADNSWARNWKPADLTAFKRSLRDKPDSHPLRQAMNVSDDALFTAIAQGKGDVRITTELFVPSTPLSIANGSGRVPTMRGQALDYSQRTSRRFTLLPPVGNAVRGGAISAPVPAPDGAAAEGPMEFLAGFTQGDGFEWSETWDFGVLGNVTVGAHAWYGVGLRIPIEVTTAMTPKTMDVTTPKAYDTTLTPRVSDADAGFYRRTGLANELLYDGKEFVLEAGAWATIDGEILLGGPFHSRFGKEFDFGQNFAPPWANCGTSCGVDVFIPATVTNTEVSLLGIATGKAEVGFNIGGSGTVGLDYTSIVGDASVASTKNGQTSRTQSIRSNGVGSEPSMHTEITGQQIPPRGLPYGFSVANPTYTWDLAVTPGVRGVVSVAVIGDLTIGPLWLRPFAIRLGSVNFPTHAGTVSTQIRKNGMVSGGVLGPGGGGVGVQPVAQAAAGTAPSVPASVSAPSVPASGVESGPAARRRRRAAALAAASTTTTTTVPVSVPAPNPRPRRRVGA